MREYTWPARSMLNSEAAWSELLKANEDVKWMGVRARRWPVRRGARMQG
jgi:hypothetical protein